MKFTKIFSKFIIIAIYISSILTLSFKLENQRERENLIERKEEIKGDNKPMSIEELRKKNQLPKTIKPTLRMNIPQSFLGTCLGVRAKEFNLSTWGIETCVGLSFHNDCNGRTFTMLTHLDAGHTNNLESYINSFLSFIPTYCPKNTQKIQISTTFSSDRDLINKLNQVLKLKFPSIPFTSKEYVSRAGLDLAIKTSDGTLQQYLNLSVDQPIIKTSFGAFSNIQPDCKLYYLGVRRICQVKENFDIAVKDYKNNIIHKIDSSAAIRGKGTFTYAFHSEATAVVNSSEENICNNSDL